MITFGEISSKTLVAPYIKEDYVGYLVEGTATYNKENVLTSANGTITDAKTQRHLANFNVYGEGEDMRISMDCKAAIMGEMYTTASATLADLMATYPQE